MTTTGSLPPECYNYINISSTPLFTSFSSAISRRNSQTPSVCEEFPKEFPAVKFISRRQTPVRAGDWRPPGSCRTNHTGTETTSCRPPPPGSGARQVAPNVGIISVRSSVTGLFSSVPTQRVRWVTPNHCLLEGDTVQRWHPSWGGAGGRQRAGVALIGGIAGVGQTASQTQRRLPSGSIWKDPVHEPRSQSCPVGRQGSPHRLSSPKNP